jgi:hypothetical protein
MMTAKSGARSHVRIGEVFGGYTLMAAGLDLVTLQWEGREFTQPIGDPLTRSRLDLEPEPEMLAWALDLDEATGPFGPGPETSSGRMCRPGDASPAGTISAGYRKVVLNTGARQVCRWVPAK